MSSGYPLQTNEDQPYQNPPQSRSSVLPPFLSYGAVADQYLTQYPQRNDPRGRQPSAHNYSYHNSTLEASQSSFPGWSVDRPKSYADNAQLHRQSYIPQRHVDWLGGCKPATQSEQGAVQPFASTQHQIEPYEFFQGYIPVSHERTGGPGTERDRQSAEPESPELIPQRPTTRPIYDYSQPTPLPAVRYHDRANGGEGLHEPREQHNTRYRTTANAYSSDYNFRINHPDHTRVSPAIHRLPATQRSPQANTPEWLQRTPVAPVLEQSEEEWSQGVDPTSSTALSDVGTTHNVRSEHLSPTHDVYHNEHDSSPGNEVIPIPHTGTISPERVPPHSGITGFGSYDAGPPVQSSDRGRQSDDDEDYVEKPARRTTDEEAWQEEKKKIVMACHFCRRECNSCHL